MNDCINSFKQDGNKFVNNFIDVTPEIINNKENYKLRGIIEFLVKSKKTCTYLYVCK